MKRFLPTIVALGLFLGLAGYIYHYEYMGEEAREDASEAEKKALVFDSEKVLEIELSPRDGAPIVLRREPAGWTIAAPLQTAADGDKVDSMLSGLSWLRIEATLKQEAGSDLDLAAFGLDPPLARVAIRPDGSSGDAPEAALLLGDETPVGRHRYAMRPGAADVLTVSGSLDAVLTADPAALRDRKVIGIDPSRVARFRLDLSGTPGSTARSVTLARQGEGWRIESPISFPADATKIQDAWWELRSAEAEAFEVDRPGEADLARFGLSRPRLSLTVEPKDGPGPIRIDFSREDPSGPVHARRSGREAVMRVGGKILETLEAMAAGVDDLRDARVAPVDRFRLARVAVRQPGAAAPAAPDDLLLFKDEESRWHRGAEDGSELPSEEVNALLDAILDMKGDSFVDNPRIDSSSGSVLTVELTERGEEARSVSVTIGPDRGEATRGVTSSTTSSEYRVPAAAVGTLLERVAALRSAKETPVAADGGSDEPDDTP